VDVAPAFRAAFAPLEGRVDSGAVWLEDGMLYVRRERTRRAGREVDAAVRRFLDAARRIPGVLRADRLRDLAKDSARDPIARRWLHMIPADFPVEAVVTQRPYSIFGNYRGAAHGSPHDYDAHVPVIFYGPAFRAGRYDDFARTADIAPTLAAALGVSPTEPLDGRPLRRALR
jgi:hypothetical protein